MVIDPLLPLYIYGSAALAACAGIYRVSRERRRVWREVAESHGVRDIEVSQWYWGLRLRGQAGPLQVEVSRPQMSADSQIRIRIPGPTGFADLSLRPEALSPWKTHEVEVGSAVFDGRYCIQGPTPLALSLFDAETRELLLLASDTLLSLGSRLELAGGELLVKTADDQLARIFPLLLRVARRFVQTDDVLPRLAHNATQDPEPGVRLRSLRLLTQDFATTPTTREVLRHAIADPSPAVRLQAAKALGLEGRETLRQLAEGLEDDEVSAEALSLLTGDWEFQSLHALLLRAAAASPRTARACLEVIAQHGAPAAFDVLVEALKHPPEVRLAAAQILGRLGTAPAVLPLKEAAALFPEDLPFTSAARQAIAHIQSRLPGASSGQLSLHGAEGGQLSLAGDSAGKLSVSGSEN